MKRPEKIKKQIRETLKITCKGTDALLVGLTGGIATGKSTVAEMFRDLGADIIDFDLLAREVVKPGKESWKLITGFFGDDILNSDNTLNRKKLSGLVFRDPLKREKLETFTHPFIWDEFIMQLDKTIRLRRDAIIQAVVPLLIEGDMHDLFIKNIVVYTSPEIQVKRLTTRDGISLKMATDILESQMPIDSKIKYGDFIINNESSIEKTAQEVNKVWKNLKLIQENRTANN